MPRLLRLTLSLSHPPHILFFFFLPHLTPFLKLSQDTVTQCHHTVTPHRSMAASVHAFHDVESGGMGSNTSQIVLWCHIYCTKCGTPAIGAAKFCHKCGQPHVSKVAQTNLQEYNEFSSSTDEELPPSKRSANSPGAKLLAADGNWNRSGALIPSRGGGSGKSSGWRQRNTEAPWMMDDVDKDLHCVCNAVVVARILATLISGGYLGWILYVFIFDLDDPNPNPDPNMDINWHYYVSPHGHAGPAPSKYTIYTPRWADILGSLSAFTSGCVLAFGYCKFSITRIQARMVMVQFIGAVVCILTELSLMAYESVRCNNHNNTDLEPFGPSNPALCDNCFKNLYWNHLGKINFPICVALLICTCISTFWKSNSRGPDG